MLESSLGEAPPANPNFSNSPASCVAPHAALDPLTLPPSLAFVNALALATDLTCPQADVPGDSQRGAGWCASAKASTTNGARLGPVLIITVRVQLMRAD